MAKPTRAEQGLANARQALTWARQQRITAQQAQLIDRALATVHDAHSLFKHPRSATQ